VAVTRSRVAGRLAAVAAIAEEIDFGRRNRESGDLHLALRLRA
jgi:hypothetical protein